MEPGYDHHDEPKDFHGGFALVKKDQAVAKKPVVTEADWTRVFGTWAVGVTLGVMPATLVILFAVDVTKVKCI